MTEQNNMYSNLPPEKNLFVGLLKVLLGTVLYLGDKLIRVLLLCMPIGVFNIIIQLRENKNSIRVLTKFVGEASDYILAAPGMYVLVTKPTALKDNTKETKKKLDTFYDNNKKVVDLSTILIPILLVVLILTIIVIF